jgi:hypothetical protein
MHPAPKNPAEAIKFFEEHRSLPAAFRFAMPGDLAHVIEIRDANQKVTDLQLRLGGSHTGCCISVSVRRYGGKANALAVLHWIARRCGLVIRNLGNGALKGSIRGTRPRGSTSGVAGIEFEWRYWGVSTVLHVIASIPATKGLTSSATQRQWSTEKWGRLGALQEAVNARLAIGAVPPDFDRLSARLEAFYEAGPTRVIYSGRVRTSNPALDSTFSIAT